MKTFSFLIVSLLFSQITWADENNLSFLLLGQSNMAGQGKFAELSEEKQKQSKNIRFYLNGSVSKLSEQIKFGPEISFAHSLSAAYPKKRINIIKFAPGGSLIKDWINNGKHYRTLKKQLARISQKTAIKPDAVLWMQGERDTKSMQLAKTYKADLKKLIKALRKDFNEPGLVFIIAQISIPKAYRPGVEKIQKAQETISKEIPSVYSFSTASLKKNPDNVHFSSEGQWQLGYLFAKNYLKKH